MALNVCFFHMFISKHVPTKALLFLFRLIYHVFVFTSVFNMLRPNTSNSSVIRYNILLPTTLKIFTHTATAGVFFLRALFTQNKMRRRLPNGAKRTFHFDSKMCDWIDFYFVLWTNPFPLRAVVADVRLFVFNAALVIGLLVSSAEIDESIVKLDIKQNHSPHESENGCESERRWRRSPITDKCVEAICSI